MIFVFYFEILVTLKEPLCWCLAMRVNAQTLHTGPDLNTTLLTDQISLLHETLLQMLNVTNMSQKSILFKFSIFNYQLETRFLSFTFKLQITLYLAIQRELPNRAYFFLLPSTLLIVHHTLTLLPSSLLIVHSTLTLDHSILWIGSPYTHTCC